MLILYRDIRSLALLGPREQVRLHLYNESGVFKYPNVIHCYNGCELKSNAKRLLKEHNVYN